MHILSQVELTGAEVYAVTLANWQIQQGHHVEIVSDELHIKTQAQFHALAIHRSTRWGRWNRILQLRKWIQQNKIDVLHAHSRAAVRIAYWARFGLNCALVSTVHGRQHSSFSKRMIDLYGERIIAVCENISFHLQQDFKMNPRKIKVIGNPLQVQKDAHQNLQPWNLLIMGRFSGPKGQITQSLMESVFPILLHQFPLLKLDFVGGRLEDLDQKGKKLFYQLQEKFPNRVHHENFVDQPDQRIASSGLILGAGRVALSAALQEKPVYCIGEHSSQGFLKSQELEKFKATNFGDIGVGPSLPVHFESLLSDLQKFYQNLSKGSEMISFEERKKIKEALHLDFDLNFVCQQILVEYKAAHFKRHFPKWFPIMMYHKVVPEPLQTKHRIFVTAETFEKHLSFYRSQNFQTLQFQDLKKFWDLERPMSEFPKKPLMITFDDGYLNNLEVAVPLLQKYGFKSTIFLLADSSLKANSWDETDGTPQLPLMNASERLALQKSGQEVGSHGFRHGRLQQMDEKQTEEEVRGSKQILEQEFKTNVSVYAYTYGHKNSQSEKCAMRAGYDFAVNTTTGGLHLSENPWSLFRVSVFPEDGITDIWKKTRSWYRKYYYRKRKE